MKPAKFILILLVFAFGSCISLHPKTIENIDMSLYRQAIRNAIYPESEEVFNQLVPVAKENDKLVWKTIDNEDYVLVVSWKQNITYYKTYLDSAFYNTGSYNIWVTTAPELYQRIKNEEPKDLNRRLIQLLGLPPNATYSYFVEFWVKPGDLFRPCPDKEITDGKCDTCFPEKTDSTHIAWINENRISRYYQRELYNQYPWTQLGYTYDWNPANKTHVGLSEFVIGKNCKIKVNAIYGTQEYFSKK